jgi:exonuclease VII large subunit
MSSLNSTKTSSSAYEMSIPNKVEMEREVRKISATVIKAYELNNEVDETLQKLDSLNNALENPKSLRQFKRELAEK